jgi:hypothetical protein
MQGMRSARAVRPHLGIARLIRRIIIDRVRRLAYDYLQFGSCQAQSLSGSQASLESSAFRQVAPANSSRVLEPHEQCKY